LSQHPRLIGLPLKAMECGYYVLGQRSRWRSRLRRLGVHRPQPQGPARVRLPGPDLPPSARYAAHIARLCAPGSSHETTASDDRDAPER
jgi:hypothetical protein